MVKGIFCHYLPIYKDINGIYCSTTLTDDLFSRYFTVVDKLYVATRVYSINKTYKEAHQEKITLDNIVIIEFPNLSTIWNYTFGKRKYYKKLEEIISDVDLIFIRGGVIANLAASASKKLHKPYLYENSGCAWDDMWNHSLAGKFLALSAEIEQKKICKNAAFVVYVTEKWLQKRYPTNGISTYASNVVLTTIDESALTNRLNKIEKKEKRSTIVLGTTGGIDNKAKGQQYVIKAISRLKKYDIRYEVVGGGNGEYLKKIAKKYGVEERLIIKGQLTHEEVLKWLDSIDLYIQPSMQEGLPRSLIEAMSRACPAIGSTTGGIPELIDQKMIFKRGKTNSLTEVLSKSIDCNMTDIALANFEKSKEYLLEKIASRRNNLYLQYKEFVFGDKK